MILEGQKLQKPFEMQGPAAGAEVCGNQKSADFGRNLQFLARILQANFACDFGRPKIANDL